MNLTKEHDQIYKEYLNFINETIKDVKSIRRMKKFILKKENVATEKEISQIEGDCSVAEEIEESEIKQKRASSKIYNFSNGDVYIGKMIDGNMDGTGIYTFSTEEGTMEYVGDFKEDMKHGKGIFTFSNGNSYIGGFENDLMNGIGKMTYSSKNEYIGNWKDGQKHGMGIYIWDEGSVYVGEFRNSKMEGYGTCYSNEGKIIYEGEWKNNLVHGKGTYTWQEGKSYTGDFLHGKKHGIGTFYLNNELVYDGTWKYDKPSICNRSLDELFSSKF